MKKSFKIKVLFSIDLAFTRPILARTSGSAVLAAQGARHRGRKLQWLTPRQRGREEAWGEAAMFTGIEEVVITVSRLTVCGLWVDFCNADCLTVILTGINEFVEETETEPAQAGPALYETGLSNTELGCWPRSCWGNRQLRLKAIKLS